MINAEGAAVGSACEVALATVSNIGDKRDNNTLPRGQPLEELNKQK